MLGFGLRTKSSFHNVLNLNAWTQSMIRTVRSQWWKRRTSNLLSLSAVTTHSRDLYIYLWYWIRVESPINDKSMRFVNELPASLRVCHTTSEKDIWSPAYLHPCNDCYHSIPGDDRYKFSPQASALPVITPDHANADLYPKYMYQYRFIHVCIHPKYGCRKFIPCARESRILVKGTRAYIPHRQTWFHCAWNIFFWFLFAENGKRIRGLNRSLAPTLRMTGADCANASTHRICNWKSISELLQPRPLFFPFYSEHFFGETRNNLGARERRMGL